MSTTFILTDAAVLSNAAAATGSMSCVDNTVQDGACRRGGGAQKGPCCVLLILRTRGLARPSQLHDVQPWLERLGSGGVRAMAMAAAAVWATHCRSQHRPAGNLPRVAVRARSQWSSWETHAEAY